MKVKTIVALSIIGSGLVILLWPKERIKITDLQLQNFMRRLESEAV